MKILTYNIQAAIATHSYLSYVTQLHRQIYPSRAKQQVLHNIARFIGDFDVVCLQEIDLGGYRNNFQNQAEQLLQHTPFAHYLYQTNRVVGKLSRHGNVILSKLPLREIVNEPLPSKIKGRGMLAAAVDTPMGEMVVANVHLSLGLRDQLAQIRFVREKLKAHENVCLVGDFNCPHHAEQLHILTDWGYRRLGDNAPTYPSWRPRQALDHIFIKGSLKGQSRVETLLLSDHLPMWVELDC